MKKFIWFIAGIMFATTITAFAYGPWDQNYDMLYDDVVYTDEDTFADWFYQEVNNMGVKGIIEGYGDGSFGPNNTLTRAELSVMLDRFDHMVQDMIERKMIDFLYSLDSLAYLDLPDDNEVNAVAVIMAEAGVRRLDAEPASDCLGLGEIEMVEEEFVGFELAENYSIYADGPCGIYVRYQGFKNFGQDGVDVDEWYGPFDVYGPTLAANSDSFY